jgi:cobalt/nickel transport system permease protein
MHMADALITPVVGGVMWGVSGVAIGYASHKLNKSFDDFKIPLMGVMGGFVFAAQMINFSIPGTGSSGHIIGSLLLAILLGPYAALLVISSVLVIQAMLFADGGLLALGCNIFNMGVIPCFIAYPFIYRFIMQETECSKRRWFAIMGASVIGLQIGALSVVLDTTFSGISELPFKTFLMMMLPIHIAIAAVEGALTVAVIELIRVRRPELLQQNVGKNKIEYRKILITIGVVTLLIAGSLSWFASENPDGLEWAIGHVTSGKELVAPNGAIQSIQEKTAFLPEYGFKSGDSAMLGTSFSGILGSIVTLAIACLLGYILKRRVGESAQLEPMNE